MFNHQHKFLTVSSDLAPYNSMKFFQK